MADPITAFTMLMASQAATFMGGPMDMVNTLTKPNYTVAILDGGRTERDLFRGGPELKDRILLEANDQGEWYAPAGFETDYDNPQTGTEMSSKWCYYRSPLVWTEHEIMHDVPRDLDVCTGVPSSMIDGRMWSFVNLVTEDLTVVDGPHGDAVITPCYGVRDDPLTATVRGGALGDPQGHRRGVGASASNDG